MAFSANFRSWRSVAMAALISSSLNAAAAKPETESELQIANKNLAGSSGKHKKSSAKQASLNGNLHKA